MELRERKDRFDGYDSEKWGQTILWFCILLLTAAVVASAAPPAAATHTATYTDGKITVALTRAGASITGTVTLNGQTYPLKATADKNDPMKMYGSFTAGGKSYPIAMGVPSPGHLNLKTGTTVYQMAILNPNADNPLNAAAENGAASAPQGAAESNPLGQPAAATPTPPPAPAPAAAPAPAPAPVASPAVPTPPQQVATNTLPPPPGYTGQAPVNPVQNTIQNTISGNNPLAGNTSPIATAAAPVFAQRPVLKVQQGQNFRWSMPDNWKSSETPNGVEIASPDGRAGTSSVMLVNTPGDVTPQDFVLGLMTPRGAQNLRFVTVRNLPEQVFGNSPMRTQQMEVTYDVNGTQYHGLATCAIISGFHNYTAIFQGAGAVPEDWDRVKTWLPAVAESVTLLNPQQAGLAQRVSLPHNRPLDDGSIASFFTARGGNMQSWTDSTLGYQRMKDPSTGQMYDVPLEAIDPTRGGYANPARPGELLERAPTGE